MNLDAFIYQNSELFEETLDENEIRSRVDELSLLEWKDLLADASRRNRKEMTPLLCEEILAYACEVYPEKRKERV